LQQPWLDPISSEIDGECPVCEDRIQGRVWYCPVCGTAHHLECYKLMNSCGACSPAEKFDLRGWFRSLSKIQLVGYGSLVVGLLCVLVGVFQMVSITEDGGDHFGAVGTMVVAAIFLVAAFVLGSAGRSKSVK